MTLVNEYLIDLDAWFDIESTYIWDNDIVVYIWMLIILMWSK